MLVGLGFKRKNLRNRALNYMLNNKRVSKIISGDIPQNQMTIMPVTRPVARRPLKFNY